MSQARIKQIGYSIIVSIAMISTPLRAENPKPSNIQPFPFAEFDKMENLGDAQTAARKYLNEKFPPGTPIKDFTAAFVAAGATCDESNPPTETFDHELHVLACSIPPHNKHRFRALWEVNAYTSLASPALLLKAVIMIESDTL